MSRQAICPFLSRRSRPRPACCPVERRVRSWPGGWQGTPPSSRPSAVSTATSALMRFAAAHQARRSAPLADALLRTGPGSGEPSALFCIHPVAGVEPGVRRQTLPWPVRREGLRRSFRGAGRGEGWPPAWWRLGGISLRTPIADRVTAASPSSPSRFPAGAAGTRPFRRRSRSWMVVAAGTGRCGSSGRGCLCALADVLVEPAAMARGCIGPGNSSSVLIGMDQGMGMTAHLH